MIIQDALRAHFKLGYTRLLLVFDIILLLLIALDLAIYHKMGLSFKLAASFGYSITGVSIGNFALFVAFMVLALPPLLAILNASGLLHANISRQPSIVLGLHLGFCLIFVFAGWITWNMELVSGYSQVDNGVGTSFESIFQSLVTSSFFRLLLTTMGSGTTVLAGFVITNLLVGKEPSKVVRQYLTRALLADLPSSLRPPRSTMGLESRHAKIPAIEGSSRRVIDQYYSARTSSKATAYIDDQIEACSTVIRRYLTQTESGATRQPEDRDNFPKIEYYTTIDAAVNAALMSGSRDENVIAGHNCSPSFDRFIEFHCRVSSAKYVKVFMHPKQHVADWNEQLQVLIEGIKKSDIQGPTALLVNEVSYATGLALPETITTSLRDVFKSLPLKVVINGSCAVGNRRKIPVGGSWDYYVLDPSHWLASPQSCGVLLLQKPRDAANTPYGLIQKGILKTEEEIRAIAGLRASLEVIEQNGLEFFWNRCEVLSQAFRLDLPRSIQVVGSRAGMQTTFFLACRPSDSSEWRVSVDELQDLIVRRFHNTSLLRIDPSQPWLRVTFPYYLDARQLNKLAASLDDSTS
jgi:hypothetical protein